MQLLHSSEKVGSIVQSGNSRLYMCTAEEEHKPFIERKEFPCPKSEREDREGAGLQNIHTHQTETEAAGEQNKICDLKNMFMRNNLFIDIRQRKIVIFMLMRNCLKQQKQSKI